MATVKLSVKLPKMHPKQLAFVESECSLTLCEASTKCGKTFGGMVWLLTKALACQHKGNYWWVAPVYRTAEMVFDRYLRWFEKQGNRAVLKGINKSKLYIELRNGARLWFKSGDNYNSLYGEDVRAAIIDEGSRVSVEAYNAVTTTLTATDGPLKIIGNPGNVGQFFHDLCRKAETGALKNALYIHMNYVDGVAAGLIRQEKVDLAKERMHPVDFARDYMGIPPSFAKTPFYANFSREHHIGQGLQADPRWPIHLSFDFNVNPMTALAAQIWQDVNGWHVRVLKEYRLANSDIYQVLDRVNADWGKWQKTFTGDATGANRNAAASNAAPMFYIIKNGLVGHRTSKTFSANPAHNVSRAHVNIALRAFDVQIDASCHYLIEDLALTECTDLGKIDKRQEIKSGRGHLGDCFRYLTHAHLLLPITNHAKTLKIPIDPD